MQVWACGVMPAGWTPLVMSAALFPQGRLRRPLPSFASPHSGNDHLGLLLDRGRCTATAQVEGGLKAAFADYRVAPIGDLASEGAHSCYTVVQPGLQSGSMYMELLVQSMRPNSRGKRGLKFWVVSLGCLLAQRRARLPLCTCCLRGPGRRILRRALSLGWWAWSSHIWGQRDSDCPPALQDQKLVWPCVAGVLVGLAAAACFMLPVFAALVPKGFLRDPLPLQAITVAFPSCMTAQCSCSSLRTDRC